MPPLLPQIVNLELTNACNLACVFCDHRKLKRTMRLGHMEPELLRRVLDGLGPGPFHELGLVGLGEPLLDPLLDVHLEIIRSSAGRFGIVSMNTNALGLDEDRARLLADSPVTNLTISLNAAGPEDYRRLMGRDAFAEVTANIRRFLALRRETGRPPHVAVQVMEPGSAAEVGPLFPGLLGGIKVFTRALYSKPVLGPAGGAPAAERHPCWSLYSRAYVDFEGRVTPCTIGNDCHRNASMRIGDAARDALGDVFNSQKARQARERAENGKLPFPECAACNIWSLLPNNFARNADGRWTRLREAVRLHAMDWS
jgi:hypothetical protein